MSTPFRALRWFVSRSVVSLAVSIVVLTSFGTAQSTGASAAAKGTLERKKVASKALEGNLSGDSATRDVSVYLPPSYATAKNRRYPVVYMLHGFTDSDDRWMGLTKHWINLTEVMDRAIASGASAEMIVVMPNAYTRFAGSMYSASVTTGDWETFVAKELVAWTDANYRTLAKRDSRGLAGHSMGGYGAMRIGMKNPEVYAAVYLLSPCCMVQGGSRGPGANGPSPAEAVRSDEDFAKASFGVKAALASAAAWAPNPKNPPFYLDLPTKNGEPQPEVLAKMTANAPLAMLDQYIFNIRRLKAIAFDAGDKDRGIAGTVVTLHEQLDAYGIAHGFAIYDGDHVNRIAERIETQTLPFFTKHLTK